MKIPLPALLVAGALALGTASAAEEKVDLKYSFGPRSAAGYTQIRPDDAYTIERGYGFDLGSKVAVVDDHVADPLKSGYVTGQNGKPFFFSAKLAPGAYRVTVTLGASAGESDTTVKSESRRLMLEAVHTASGQHMTRTFLAHVRVPQIPGGGMVSLKSREKDLYQLFLYWEDNQPQTFLELDWDEKLTLEFSDGHPALDAIEITNAEKPVTVYLVGDSTMTDQMMEPWGAWGMHLPRWFKPPVLIANYAESGESARSFIGERRWPKLMSEIHAGDYVLIQFGINDRGTPFDQFKGYFNQFIKDTRDHGATPVLVTSQNLRKLDENGKGVQTLGGYPDAMKEVAKEQNVTLLDLNAMSMSLYAAIGAEKLPKAFVDGTHQNVYGSYELTKCVVQAIIDAKLPFVMGNLVDDWKPFDPAQPDPMEDFKLPPDPQRDPKVAGGPGAPTVPIPVAGRAGEMASPPPPPPARNPPAAK
jgi:lysophospholipase L1-like esterase